MAFNPDIIQSINGFYSEHYLLALFACCYNQTSPRKQHASLRLAAVLAGGNN